MPVICVCSSAPYPKFLWSKIASGIVCIFLIQFLFTNIFYTVMTIKWFVKHEKSILFFLFCSFPPFNPNFWYGKIIVKYVKKCWTTKKFCVFQGIFTQRLKWKVEILHEGFMTWNFFLNYLFFCRKGGLCLILLKLSHVQQITQKWEMTVLFCELIQLLAYSFN